MNNCQHPDNVHSGIKNGVYYENLCEYCVGVLGSSQFARQYDRQWQRRHFAKDIIQPTEKDFAKQYGADKAREYGWSEDELRKYG